jgi:predicted transcriptional regulator
MRVTFTDRELDVMAVLWDRGSATVAEVRERLSDELAYTTVLSVLRTLEVKGHVGHRGEGKAHRYFPLVERRVAGRSALARLIDTVFNGSPELLLTQLVSDRDLTEEQIKRLRRLMDARIRGDKR